MTALQPLWLLKILSEPGGFSHAKNLSERPFHACIILMLLQVFFCTLLYTTGYAGNDEQTIEIMRLAQSGDGQAQFSLAMMYDLGNDLPRDPEKTVYWLSKAAEHNLPVACLYLGMKYEYGNGVEKNKNLAEKWYKQAAAQNWAMAQYLLALLYLDNNQETSKKLEAATWLQLAASQEYPGAKEKLQETVQQLSIAEKKQLLINREKSSSQIIQDSNAATRP